MCAPFTSSIPPPRALSLTMLTQEASHRRHPRRARRLRVTHTSRRLRRRARAAERGLSVSGRASTLPSRHEPCPNLVPYASKHVLTRSSLDRISRCRRGAAREAQAGRQESARASRRACQVGESLTVLRERHRAHETAGSRHHLGCVLCEACTVLQGVSERSLGSPRIPRKSAHRSRVQEPYRVQRPGFQPSTGHRRLREQSPNGC